jgi:hypothetical protein
VRLTRQFNGVREWLAQWRIRGLGEPSRRHGVGGRAGPGDGGWIDRKNAQWLIGVLRRRRREKLGEGTAWKEGDQAMGKKGHR